MTREPIQGPSPFATVVVRGGLVFLQPWNRVDRSIFDKSHGAAQAASTSAKGVFDLSRRTSDDGDRELFVLPLNGRVPTSLEMNALIAFAESTGYRRAYVPTDDLLGPAELSGLIPFGTTATSHCATCGYEVSDDSYELFKFVAFFGCWPSNCPACNSNSVAQWSVAQDSDLDPSFSLDHYAESSLFEMDTELHWPPYNPSRDEDEAGLEDVHDFELNDEEDSK